jgi:hypothetical protein
VLLPLLAFFAGIGTLIVTHFGWTATVERWQRLDGAGQVILAGGAVIALLLLTQFGEVLMQPVVRAYEGYWNSRKTTPATGSPGI